MSYTPALTGMRRFVLQLIVVVVTGAAAYAATVVAREDARHIEVTLIAREEPRRVHDPPLHRFGE